MPLTSDEVNYLVLRYLAESGFEHTAFTLKNEMRNAEQLETAWASRVPTGHLIDSLQRALMFQECLAQIDENGMERVSDTPIQVNLIPDTADKAHLESQQNGLTSSKKRLSEQVPSQASKMRQLSPPHNNNSTVAEDPEDEAMPDNEPEAVKESTQQISRIVPLTDHKADVDQCFWHPWNTFNVITSSKDGTARKWNVSKDASQATSLPLDCSASKTSDRSVTSIAWESEGNFIATGSYDGTIRVWNADCCEKLNRDLVFHTGPIFALKWSHSGDFLLSGSADGMVGVWQTESGTLQQKWDLKSAVMDLEWISDALFLTACQDGSLRMWQLNREHVVKQYNNNKSSITVFRWNGFINLGATGAADSVVKVWRADSEHPTQILKFHKAPVLALEWAPKDYGDRRLLASAAKDGRVCVADAVKGELLHLLHHDRAIFSLHFSKDNLLVTAGEESEVTVWHAETGAVVATRKSPELGVINHVRFSNDGDRIAVASAKSGAILWLPKEGQ